MKVISVRQNPEYKEKAIKFFQKSWSEISPIIYEDCISNSIAAEQSLPQWYLLEKDEEIIGCAGLITNDFISRMDLYPWLCALKITEEIITVNLLLIKLKKTLKIQDLNI